MKKVLVYLGATMPEDNSYVEAVRQFGEELARRGFSLLFGGSREGTMTVLADAVLNNGGRAIGVFTKALPEKFLYHGLSETIITEDLAERKNTMFEKADAIVAFPGSFGTWDELFDALERIKIDVMQSRPAKPAAVLNLNGFYDGTVELLQRSAKAGH
ncbi:MAG: TIGR00730 family Rossman fold protein, partial [Lentisphaeria bacterium]|nr:TIGR00730 family Rossman fold protein [Lentisphaeria bacterium]